MWTDSLGEGTYYGKVRAVGCCAWSGWSDSVEIVIVDDDIEEFPSATLPKEFRLEQNHPNPFNPATTIEYDVPIRSLIKIEVYNLLGQSVRVLLNAHKSSGNYRITWDGKDSSGRSVSSGIYFYRFQAGDYVETKKMVLMK
ncbi:MAG: T9SS type A sorting domain-containing protein [candidate division Zixibacteria bacterium]|nr:T9SS type A sorting domain-containing protein [candidate division Zixibacteria bacterium]